MGIGGGLGPLLVALLLQDVADKIQEALACNQSKAKDISKLNPPLSETKSPNNAQLIV